MMWILYMIENNVNDKIYIGTTNNMIRRKAQHRYDANRNVYHYPIYNAMRKYGIDNFSFHEIEYHDTAEQVNEAEKYWIHQLRESLGKEMLYNIEAGGRNASDTEEIRMKKSLSQKGRPKPKNQIEKTAAKLRGRKHSPDCKHCVAVRGRKS